MIEGFSDELYHLSSFIIVLKMLECIRTILQEGGWVPSELPRPETPHRQVLNSY